MQKEMSSSMHEFNNITELSHELTYHRYMLNQGQVRGLFQNITIPEYIALHYILHSITEKGSGTNKAYLQDVANELRLPLSRASRMVGNLRDKGLVSWSHDGNGSEGTYITITDSGVRLLEKQEARLKDYYGRVAEKFGEENMVTLLKLMIQLERVMDSEMDSEGDEAGDA